MLYYPNQIFHGNDLNNTNFESLKYKLLECKPEWNLFLPLVFWIHKGCCLSMMKDWFLQPWSLKRIWK